MKMSMNREGEEKMVTLLMSVNVTCEQKSSLKVITLTLVVVSLCAYYLFLVSSFVKTIISQLA